MCFGMSNAVKSRSCIAVNSLWKHALCQVPRMNGNLYLIFNLTEALKTVDCFGRKSCRRWCQLTMRKQRFLRHKCRTQSCRSAQPNSFCWLCVLSVNSQLDSTCGRSSWTMNQLNQCVSLCHWVERWNMCSWNSRRNVASKSVIINSNFSRFLYTRVKFV